MSWLADRVSVTLSGEKDVSMYWLVNVGSLVTIWEERYDIDLTTDYFTQTEATRAPSS